MKLYNFIKTHYIFTFIYLSVSILFIYLLTNDSNKHVNHQLQNITKTAQLEYDIINELLKDLSNLTFDLYINNEDILSIYERVYSQPESIDISREKLKKLLTSKYEILKNYHIYQFHFHLKNNESFLRMHKQELYGDDLTFARETVKITNRDKKSVHGFETGKIVHGFRNVFPLIYNEKHLGSVELSFSDDAIIRMIEKKFPVHTNIIVNENDVKHKVFKEFKKYYKKSLVSDKYVYSNFSNHYNHIHENTSYTNILASEKKSISDMIDKEKAFSIKSTNNNSKVITFIPIKDIKNQIVAYLVSFRSDDIILENMIQFKINLALLLTSLISVFYVFYKKFTYEDELNKTIKHQENTLITHSRMAAMGELISMIAHQWRQPLGSISAIVVDLQMKSEFKDYDITNTNSAKEYEKYINTNIQKIQIIIHNLTTTIDDFRSFYKPNKKVSQQYTSTVCEKTIKIIDNSLKSNKIEYKIINNSNMKIKMYENEIIHVILNILRNAQDNFIFNDTINPYIEITANDNSIKICDNGGGIEDDIMFKIFEPYFSTKNEKIGTGLGLYMSKTIIVEHHNGTLNVVNTDNGVCFEVIIGNIKEII